MLFVLLAGHDAVLAETVTLNPAQDTYLAERLTAPQGSGTEMVIGTQGANVSFTRTRGLVRFDLSSIPPGAVVNSVVLRLAVTRVPLTPVNSDFHLHRLLRPWNEEQSTWLLRLAPTENWTTPGGQAGTDFSTTVSGRVPVAAVGGYTFASTPQLVADVTAWLASPSANHGWLVKTADESVGFTARRFASREGLAGAPVLEVQFDPPAPLLRINSTELVAADFCLRFTARQGKAYVVERRGMVDTGTWNVITNLPPVAVTGEIVVCDPLGAGNNFYRVGEQ